jgi:hypothetical protein
MQITVAHFCDEMMFFLGVRVLQIRESRTGCKNTKFPRTGAQRQERGARTNERGPKARAPG